MGAHERLGDLFVAAQKWPKSVAHYVWSGRIKKLKQLAKLLPDEPFPFSPPSDHAPHSERIASFEFAATIGQLLPDDLASAWACTAFHELRSAPMRAGITETWLPAFTTFASVADAATLEIAELFLDHTDTYLDRQ